MNHDAELQKEQQYIDNAYRCLEVTRAAAASVVDMIESGAGGTFQARFERNVAVDHANARSSQLDVGDQSLCFGRIDQADSGESFYIGRVAVSDDDQEPVIVDWRAPIAEAFYRATGRDPLGLARRRQR